MYLSWNESAVRFLKSSCGVNGASSVPRGPTTLYGTAYAWMSLHYLGHREESLKHSFETLVDQYSDPSTGLLLGPELSTFPEPLGSLHSLEHLQFHLTCSAVLPVASEIEKILPKIHVAQGYSDIENLEVWQQKVDWKNAWFEGNNILFVGQLLVYLRDVENHPDAQNALNHWFAWLEKELDPATSLWGTNGYCETAAAVYGGYHQLLVYWHEDHPIQNPKGLVDAVLSLRHHDGGFNPRGNAGACEDVDSVDILVNCYKRWDYRRAEIRVALGLCVDHILASQNPDGGFPYNRDKPQSHMGIPGTEADPNVSCTFPTWFRIHTLALCHEIIPEHPKLKGIPFRFNSYLSMGWHKSPPGWKLEVSETQRAEEQKIRRKWIRQKRTDQIQRSVSHLKTRLIYYKNQARVKAGAIKRRLKG